MIENERQIGLLTTVSQSANQAGTGAAKPQPGHHCLPMQLTAAGFFHWAVGSLTKTDCNDSNHVGSDLFPYLVPIVLNRSAFLKQ